MLLLCTTGHGGQGRSGIGAHDVWPRSTQAACGLQDVGHGGAAAGRGIVGSGGDGLRCALVELDLRRGDGVVVAGGYVRLLAAGGGHVKLVMGRAVGTRAPRPAVL